MASVGGGTGPHAGRLVSDRLAGAAEGRSDVVEYYNGFLLPHDIHAVLGLMAWRNMQDVAIMSLTRSTRQLEDAEQLVPFMPRVA